jgi:hypothetical protein
MILVVLPQSLILRPFLSEVAENEEAQPTSQVGAYLKLN